jgi:hypothetical protein
MRFISFLFLTVIIYACSPKISSRISVVQPSLSPTDYVLVLQKEDAFECNGIEIGTIKSGDNGFSSNCSYEASILLLKALARQKGANVIKITDRKGPDVWSTCERIKAKIYRVNDISQFQNEVEWHRNAILKWENFKAKLSLQDSLSSVAAKTYCGFQYTIGKAPLTKRTEVSVKTIFDCKLSWVKPEERNRKELLEHEQIHFNICELYARQLKKKLTEAQFTSYNISGYSYRLFMETSDDYKKRQDLYDAETNHGLDVAKQIIWKFTIDNELLNFEQWATDL